ncbi:MAG: xanthine dehydrogenase accessory protein XdhC [Betaproteobacteria bacterium]
MSQHAALFFSKLTHGNAVLVTVQAARGSVPRGPGAWMAVFSDQVVGSVGGGHLEFDAIAQARALVQGDEIAALQRFTLGPNLGQCCGGQVMLRFERVSDHDRVALLQRLTTDRAPVALFGGGHVGAALAHALAPLPLRLTWIDSRDGIFPTDVPAGVQCEHSNPVQGAVPGLAAQSRVLIMSFSHAEDLDIVEACLLRQRSQGDLPFVGLIGSKTKWATFVHRLLAKGFSQGELAHVTCPIGIPGIVDKQPEVIAASVAAQLLLGLA